MNTSLTVNPTFNVFPSVLIIDVGSYVEFSILDNIHCFGRVTRTTISPIIRMELTINQFVDLEKINEMVPDEDNVPHIRNRYVDVEGELVQTNHFLRNVAREAVTKIIFVFKKDAMVNGCFPREGMMDTYFLWYQYDTKFHSIGDNECLPFPCCYKNFPTCISYTRRIYS